MAQYSTDTALGSAVIIRTKDSNGYTTHGSGALIQGQAGLYIGSVAHNALDTASATVESRFSDDTGVYFVVSRAGYVGIARAQLVRYSEPCEGRVPTYDHLALEVLPYSEAREVVSRFAADEEFLALLDLAGEESGVTNATAALRYGSATQSPAWYLTATSNAIDLQDLANQPAYAPNQAYMVAGYPGGYKEQQTGIDGIRRPEERVCRATSMRVNAMDGSEEAVRYACVEDGRTIDRTLRPGASGGMVFSQDSLTGLWEPRGMHSRFVTNMVSTLPNGEKVPYYEGSAVTLAPLYAQLNAMDEARIAGSSIAPMLNNQATLTEPYSALDEICMRDVHIADLLVQEGGLPLALRQPNAASLGLRGRLD